MKDDANRYIFAGMDMSRKPTLWERFCLMFTRGKWHSDESVAVFVKVRRGKIYILKERG